MSWPSKHPNHARNRQAEHRTMPRIETEIPIVITCLAGDIHHGVLKNMNVEAVAAYVDGELEPGNRVTISYESVVPEGKLEVQAIVRRRHGHYYVFDTSLVDVIDSAIDP